MSTRAQIGFYGSEKDNLNNYEALLYKHSDGYPEGILPLITDFLNKFNKERGLGDCEYAAAWLIHHLIDDHIKHMVKLKKEYSSIPRGGMNFLGHGVCLYLHGDIEYYYKVSPQSIKVYEVVYRPDREINFDSMKLIKTVKLNT